MYAFDVAQQFGWVPPIVAAVGLVHLARHDLRRFALILLIFVVTVVFALSYNVGDAHVFFLPSHLVVALLVACGVVALQRAIGPGLGRIVPIALIALAGWNAFVNYPALDRSDDRRPTAVLNSMTDGISERSALLLTELNWQIQNGLTYFGQYVRPEVLHAWLPEVMLYAPALLRDNAPLIGRLSPPSALPDRSAQRTGPSSASRSTVRPRLWSPSSAPFPRALATCCAC